MELSNSLQFWDGLHCQEIEWCFTLTGNFSDSLRCQEIGWWFAETRNLEFDKADKARNWVMIYSNWATVPGNRFLVCNEKGTEWWFIMPGNWVTVSMRGNRVIVYSPGKLSDGLQWHGSEWRYTLTENWVMICSDRQMFTETGGGVMDFRAW
jgi:hypothetical protein